ncbi:MAG: cofactor-independent phosphoglycerate mutase [Deltaproteobacteria bacterium]|nr:cofactor-independent phosphoglycerate mutase [Deltaproteobacteria bacterium]
MKTIILLGDGMADEPLEELGGKTPLEASQTPFMDKLASRGEMGMVRTIQPGFPPGSDVANMAIMGLDPVKYYTGRAPIEATSMGVKLQQDDTAFRINFVTLSRREAGFIMEDYCSDHITTKESGELIEELKASLPLNETTQLYTGIEYRHLMVIKGFENVELTTTPPHDIIGEHTETYLPNDVMLKKLINDSMDILKDHPVNLQRRKQGLREATAIWPWGEGKGLNVPTLQDEFQIQGAMISAVDLLKGLGILRGMEIINVPGATGWIDTNYLGKAKAAIEALSRVDVVYVHVEAPDEAGHAGLTREKIQAIENFDKMVVGHTLTSLEAQDINFRVLFMPDHPTPIAKRTHTADPVPFVIYDNRNPQRNSWKFSESEARNTGVFLEQGHSLLKRLLS